VEVVYRAAQRQDNDLAEPEEMVENQRRKVEEVKGERQQWIYT